MYKVEIDKSKKLIKMDLSGFMRVDEVEALSKEVEQAFNQFGPKEAFVLGNLVGFKPASADVLPVFQKLQAKAVQHSKKMAAVHDSALAQMQTKRVTEQTGANANSSVGRFKTEEEALKYLFE